MRRMGPYKRSGRAFYQKGGIKMETIKNYLESMFANLPNTPEVLRAKQELLQMMEDKYAELIEEGKTENDAVGTVISEFGNLDELKETLKLDPVIEEYEAPETRKVSLEDAKAYINAEAKNSLLIGFGVMLCIMSVIPTIIASAFDERFVIAETIGVSLMFVMIAFAVGIFIISGNEMKLWKFLKKEPCSIDYATGDYVYSERLNNNTSRVLQLTIGIILCIISVVPTIVIEGVASVMKHVGLISSSGVLGPTLLFVFVGLGVLLIISSGGKEKAYHVLLSLNDRETVAGNYESVRGDVRYENETLDKFMAIYWKAILCIYLIWSFTTFQWGATWLIWPIAGIVKGIIEKNYGKRERR